MSVKASSGFLSRANFGPKTLAILIALFLIMFLAIPVAKVFIVAFQDPNTGSFTLINFVDFFQYLIV